MSKMNRGEQYLLKQGLYIAEPLCFMVLFSQSERDVLNTIRHCSNVGERYLSLSAISATTGMSENAVKKARNRLLEEGFIEKQETCKAGTHFEVVYKRLNNIVAELNSIKDPRVREERAKQIRGK